MKFINKEYLTTQFINFLSKLNYTFSKIGHKHNVSDINDFPSIPKNISDLSEDATHRTVTDTEKNNWNNKSDFSGDYDDLTNKPTIPTKVSELDNDSGFLTEHQSLEDRAVNHTLRNENLNEVTVVGFYNADSENAISNKPSGVNQFGLIVVHDANGEYYTQKLFTDTTQYTRKCVNGLWSDWVEDKLTDTWRGIQDNLTSNSTTDSLSANQGRILNETLYNKNRPFFIFVDDDGKSNFNSLYTNILEPRKIKAGLSICFSDLLIGKSGYLSAEELKTYESKGNDILCHSTSISSIELSSADSVFRYCINQMKKYGFNNNGIFVYPNGNNGSDKEAIEQIASNYFKYGLNINYNHNCPVSIPIENPQDIGRIFINAEGQNTDAIKSYYKNLIDDAFVNNKLMIISTHSNSYDPSYLAEVLDYIIGKGGKFQSPTEVFREIESSVIDLKQDKLVSSDTIIVDGNTLSVVDGKFATLGDDGKIPSFQLPSYVDDVIEGENISDFPSVGESGKIYVDLSSNKTYRWGGSQYVEISESLAIGDSIGMAYDGGKGKALEDKVNSLPKNYAPTDAEKNIIIGVKKNGTLLTVGTDRTVNVTVPTQASDVGAMANTVTHLSGDVPITRKVNDKTLSADITLTASDVDALPSTTKIPSKTSDLTNDSGFITSYTNTTYTLTQDATDGHKITLTPSSGSATTITIPDNNTWRGIQNNLTSTSTTDSLSANQGKVLKDLVDGKSNVGHTHTKSEITDFPTSMTPTAHNQASDTINAMTGYSKPTSTSAITTSDTLNSAIGKLEKALDGKGTSSFSGNYNDLTNKPTIPTVNNATLTIQKNGTNVSTFTANASSNVTANITVPTKVSELTNDSGYKTTDNDTKNTAGATDTSSKIFLIGATSQDANPQTYSHDTAYVGTDGCLYSGGTKVLTSHQSLSGYATQSWVEDKNYLTGITKSQVTTALGYTPPTQDTNTTYSFATGDNNGQIKVTPLGGSAQNISVKGLGSLAYSSATIPTVTDTYSSTSSSAMSGKAVNSAISSLQPKLVAGSNITIDPNTHVISASGGSAEDVINIKCIGDGNYKMTDYYSVDGQTIEDMLVPLRPIQIFDNSGNLIYVGDGYAHGGEYLEKDKNIIRGLFSPIDSFAVYSTLKKMSINSQVVFGIGDITIESLERRYYFNYNEIQSRIQNLAYCEPFCYLYPYGGLKFEYTIRKKSEDSWSLQMQCPWKYGISDNGHIIDRIGYCIIELVNDFKMKPKNPISIKDALELNVPQTVYFGGTLKVGDTRLQFINSIFKGKVAIDIYAEDQTIGYLNRIVEDNILTLIFAPQTKDINIRVRVERIGG